MHNHSLKILSFIVAFIIFLAGYVLKAADTAEIPYPGLPLKQLDEGGNFKLIFGEHAYSGKITVKAGKVGENFYLTPEQQKKQNIVLSVSPEKCNGAEIWKIKLKNQSPTERFLELRLTLSGKFSAQGNYYDGFDNHKIESESIVRNDLDETIPLGIYYSDDFGLALGLTPLTLTSYLQNRFDKNNMSCAVRTVIPSGKAVEFKFVAFAFTPNWRFKDGINLYHTVFDTVFTKRKDVDPRLFTGTDSLACGRVTGTYQAGKNKSNPNKFIKQAYAGWGGHEWVYAPFKRCGDWLVRENLWNWNMPEKDIKAIAQRSKSGKNCDLIDFKNFKKQRLEMFNYMNYDMNILPCFYVINWLEGDLVNKLDGMKYNYENSSSKAKMLRWVTCTSDEYQIYPWASIMQQTIENDVPELIKELNLTAFALDCAGNKTKYRGQLDYFIPGWAYDEKGKYICTGIGHALLLDYIRKQRNGEFQMGVISNGANPFYVASRVETSLFEHKTQPHVNYRNFKKERLFMGNKVLQLHSGAGFFNPGLDIDWQSMTAEQIKIYYQHIIDKALIGCWQTGFLPSTSYQMGNETFARAIPKLVTILNKGYRCVPGITGDERLERTRYGRQLDSVVAVSNPEDTTVASDERILSRYFTDGAVIPFDYDGAQADFTIESDNDCKIPLNVVPGKTRLIQTLMAIKPAKRVLIKGRSWKTDNVETQQAFAVLALPEQGRATLRVEIPDTFALEKVSLNGRDLKPEKEQIITLEVGENKLTAVFKSKIFASPEKEIVNFSLAQSNIKVAENADAREKGAAVQLKNFIRLFLPKSRTGSHEILIGVQYGKVFVKGNQLFIGGKTPFEVQQNLSSLLRLVFDKRGMVEPYRLHMPIEPTSSMLKKAGVTKSGYFPETKIDSQTVIPKSTLKAIAIRSSDNDMTIPTVAVPDSTVAPRLDGKLDDPVWNKAAVISLLTPLVKGGKIYDNTTCRLLFTKDMLWMGVECMGFSPQLSPGRKLAHDSDKIWMGNEHLEIFIAPGVNSDGKDYPFYQLLVDAYGNTWDAWKRKMDWTSAMQVKVYGEEGKWTAEIGIPLASLAGSESKNWRFNIARLHALRNSWSTWAPVLERLQRSSSFGVLTRAGHQEVAAGKQENPVIEMKGPSKCPVKVYFQDSGKQYKWILKIPDVKPEALSQLNMYLNVDPGQKTGRMPLIDGADWRLTVDVERNKITALKYGMITTDTPKNHYGKLISFRPVPQYKVKVSRSDDNYVIELDKDVFEEAPINSGMVCMLNVSVKGEKTLSGIFKCK